MPLSGYDENLKNLQSQLELQPDKPEETHENTLQALWLLAAGIRKSVLSAQHEELPELSTAQLARLKELMTDRTSGTPLAHLTQRQTFKGLEFFVGPDALIPRQETELLADTAAAFLSAANSPKGLRCLDVGTGCGNLAIVLARTQAGLDFTGLDISAAAIALAQKNAAHHNTGPELKFLTGDLFGPVDSEENYGTYDLIVCNPPYISSGQVPQMAEEISNHEPSAAFDGGFGGMSIVRRLISDAPRFLTPGGWLVFEIGAGQGQALMARMQANDKFENVAGVADQQDVIRVLVAQRTSI